MSKYQKRRALLADRSAFSAALLMTATYLVASGPSFAAGYGLREGSTTAMGAAYAGSSASGSDASFLAYNPASLAEVDQFDFSVGMISLIPTSSADYPSAITSALTPTGGASTQSDFVKTAYVPSLATRMRLSDQWTAGLVVYAPWGLATGYEGDWAGRYYGVQTRFLTLNITPTIAYQVTENFSIAAGPQIQYAKGLLTNMVDIGTIGYANAVPGSIPGAQDGNAVFRADDWGFGFVVGAMAALNDNVTVGLSYHSAVKHVLLGTLDFTLDSDGIGAILNGVAGILSDTPAKTDLTTPDTVNFGARVQLDDRWTALLEVDWTNWSHFDELRVDSANPFQPDDVTVKNWEGAWLFALGAEYSPNEMWTWRGGVALDQTPVPDATRNVRIPDSDRYWVSLGVSYQASERFNLGLSYAHMFLPDQNVTQSFTRPANTLRGQISGRTEAAANVIGVQMNYRLP